MRRIPMPPSSPACRRSVRGFGRRSQRQNRERIVQAAVDLLREVGRAQATIAEIERRTASSLTLYNHFADEADLFGGCQESG
jgi:AcrR family transcriptional regulator